MNFYSRKQQSRPFEEYIVYICTFFSLVQQRTARSRPESIFFFSNNHSLADPEVIFDLISVCFTKPKLCN